MYTMQAEALMWRMLRKKAPDDDAPQTFEGDDGSEVPQVCLTLLFILLLGSLSARSRPRFVHLFFL